MKSANYFVCLLLVLFTCSSLKAQVATQITPAELTITAPNFDTTPGAGSYNFNFFTTVQNNLPYISSPVGNYVLSFVPKEGCKEGLPPGLSLNQATGVISGTPTATDKKDYCFAIRIGDRNAPYGVITDVKVNLSKQVNNVVKAEAEKKGKEDPYDNNRFRAIVGLEQTGSSGSTTESKPFIEFFFTTPIGKSPFGLWGNVKLTSTPDAISALGVFPSNALSDSLGRKGDLAQGFEFLVGLEYNVSKRFSLTASWGAVTPFLQDEQTIRVFKVPAPTDAQYPLFRERFPQAIAAAKPNVAFVFPERDRFLRQYFVGFRVRSWGKNNEDNFPNLFDAMIGQSEVVTGGKLRGPVIRFDGAYRLPILTDTLNDSLFIFGNASFHFYGRNEPRTPLFLQSAPSDINVFNSDVFVIPDQQKSRDIYRIGIGVNLMKLFKQDKPKN